MSTLTILLFIIYTLLLGITTTFFIKKTDNFLEKLIMNIGIGIGTFTLLGVILNFLHTPLDWKIFLLISIIIPIYLIATKLKHIELKPKLKLTKSNIYIIAAIILFIITFYMYHTGTFAYPYLEDDDPWNHAGSIKYISIEKTAYDPPTLNYRYIDPYPPGYDLFLAILHQTSPNLMWTMKFFNALLISLSILFFYFFAKEFTQNRNIALFSTFVLFAIPCYLSHFIWSISLFMPIMFAALYCLEKIKQNKLWIYPASITIAAMLLSQPTYALKAGLMFAIYWLIKALYSKTVEKDILKANILGIIISGIFWWFWKFKDFWLARQASDGTPIAASGKWLYVRGTADRIYSLSDFITAPAQNMINNPLGLGLILSLLITFTVIIVLINYKKLKQSKNTWITISLIWLLFTFIGIHGARLPVQFIAFRFWILFAIPLSLLAAQGIEYIVSLCRPIKIPRSVIIILFVILLFFGSFSPKYSHNTSPNWPPGVLWTIMQTDQGIQSPELAGYMWIKDNLPKDTRIFTLYNDNAVLGSNMFICQYCEDEINFKKTAINSTPEQISNFLKSHNYEYLVLGGMQAQHFGQDKLQKLVDNLGKTDFFSITQQNQAFLLLKVN